MHQSFYLLVGVAAMVWLFALVTAGLAIAFNRSSKLGAALLLSIVSLLVSSFGLFVLNVSAKKTVNGVVQWSFNSRWFFLTTILLGLVALALTIWSRRKGRSPIPAAN